MTKFKRIRAVDTEKNGTLVLNLASTAADDDWIRAARLARKAEEGDEEAAKELECLRETPMVIIDQDDEDGGNVEEL